MFSVEEVLVFCGFLSPQEVTRARSNQVKQIGVNPKKSQNSWLIETVTSVHGCHVNIPFGWYFVDENRLKPCLISTLYETPDSVIVHQIQYLSFPQTQADVLRAKLEYLSLRRASRVKYTRMLGFFLLLNRTINDDSTFFCNIKSMTGS